MLAIDSVPERLADGRATKVAVAALEVTPWQAERLAMAAARARSISSSASTGTRIPSRRSASWSRRSTARRLYRVVRCGGLLGPVRLAQQNDESRQVEQADYQRIR